MANQIVRLPNSRSDSYANQFIRFQMPDELVSAYDWTSPLEKEMMKNVYLRSQKVLYSFLFIRSTNTDKFQVLLT